jgi:hypothetical protein
MTTHLRNSLEKINKYLIKGSIAKIFDPESEIPILKETIMFIKTILKKHYCLAIIPQAIEIGIQNRIYNKDELKEIRNILKDLRIFDNTFTNKLLRVSGRNKSFP